VKAELSCVKTEDWGWRRKSDQDFHFSVMLTCCIA